MKKSSVRRKSSKRRQSRPKSRIILRTRTLKRIPKGKRCSQLLQQKIAINLAEYAKGRYVSRAQAIAVAYKQIEKIYPSCKSVFTKKRLN